MKCLEMYTHKCHSVSSPSFFVFMIDDREIREPGPWLELARLYGALGEGDVLRGLLLKAAGEEEGQSAAPAGGAEGEMMEEDGEGEAGAVLTLSTRQALELELEGDLNAAQVGMKNMLAHFHHIHPLH